MLLTFNKTKLPFKYNLNQYVWNPLNPRLEVEQHATEKQTKLALTAFFERTTFGRNETIYRFYTRGFQKNGRRLWRFWCSNLGNGSANYSSVRRFWWLNGFGIHNRRFDDFDQQHLGGSGAFEDFATLGCSDTFRDSATDSGFLKSSVTLAS